MKFNCFRFVIFRGGFWVNSLVNSKVIFHINFLVTFFLIKKKTFYLLKLTKYVKELGWKYFFQNVREFCVPFSKHLGCINSFPI